MKLGVVGLLPEWHSLDRAAAQRVREAGFRGASIIIPRPLEAEADDLRRLKEAVESAGLEVAQANGMFERLVDPDEAARAEGIRGLRAMIRIGRTLNAGTVFVRPGSINPNSHWFPHPENHTPRTLARLVDSLRQAAAPATAEAP